MGSGEPRPTTQVPSWGREDAAESPAPGATRILVRAAQVTRGPTKGGQHRAVRAKVTPRGPLYHLPLRGCSRARVGPQLPPARRLPVWCQFTAQELRARTREVGPLHVTPHKKGTKRQQGINAPHAHAGQQREG